MTLEQMNGGPFRFYRYVPDDDPTAAPIDLLSVTSVRQLCGIGYQLNAWQLANIADAALGTQERLVVGPRGGIKKVRQVWEYPSEFARRYAETKGQQGKIDDLRTWLRERGEDPRNVAAMRGTIVHEAIEKNVAWDRIERAYVESAFSTLSPKDRSRLRRAISDEDVHFIRNSVRQYWAMREAVPMVILAREVRIVNLTAGFAGTFDALVWLLGTFAPDGAFVPLPEAAQAAARALRAPTVADVNRVGGTLACLDWKTATDLHTDNVVQDHAYLSGEFACGPDGRRDERVTQLLRAAMWGGLVHIRPNAWRVALFPYEEGAVRAFLGSVAFARYLAAHPKPDNIFTAVLRGESNEGEEDIPDA